MPGGGEYFANVGHVEPQLRRVDVVDDVFESLGRDAADLHHFVLDFSAAHVGEESLEIRRGSSKDSAVRLNINLR